MCVYIICTFQILLTIDTGLLYVFNCLSLNKVAMILLSFLQLSQIEKCLKLHNRLKVETCADFSKFRKNLVPNDAEFKN